MTSLYRFARVGCVIVVANAVAVFAGTAFAVPWLANPFGGVTMKVNAAVLLIMLSAALMTELRGEHAHRPVFSKLMSAAVGAVAALTLVEYAFGVRLGMDELLVSDRIARLGALAPGRMAPSTAVALLSLSLGGLFAARPEAGRIWNPRQGFAVIAGAVAYTSLVDQLFAVSVPASLHRQMAFSAAVSLCLLSFALLATAAESGVARVFTGELLGAQLARWLMGAVLLIPLGVDWLRLQGERRGLYDTTYGVALMVVATALLLGILVVAGAESINRTDRERKLYVAQLRGAQSDLKQANAFLDAIFENLPTMVFVKEAERLTFTRVNKKAEEIIGKPRSELLGRADRELFPATQADAFERDDRKTIAGGVLVDIPEEPLRTVDGTRWLHTKKVPIGGEEGTPKFLLGISEDITELKRNAEALRLARDLAESNSRELEAFSYSVSHDLRAPLRSIDGFSQALMEDCGAALSAEGQDSLRRIRAAAQRMGELIDDLLALSKVTRAELRAEDVDLSALATEAAETLRQQQPQRHVAFEVEPSLRASADRRLMRAVFDNLLGNAWKFTSKKAQPVVRVARASETQDAVSFCVKDNGAGFDQQYSDKLFGAFQRLHSPKDFDGTGIGLATVQRIIHRHGGRVWAEGVVGEGASFYFTLPKARSPGGT